MCISILKRVFKSFKAEVELQPEKKIKIVKSDRGGEYYGIYDRRPWSFAIFLKECEIVPQYTMSSKPSMNGVAKRRNQTLKDMMRSIISHSSLCGEALNTYIQ
ncbi:hypothetical protein CR513_56792, partial [Mucuna pruriens]